MDKNQIIALISKVRRDSSAFIEKEMREMNMEGLLPSHGAILGALFSHNGKLRMKELSEITKRDKSTITFLVNLLCTHGYAVREKGERDSREVYITLTEKVLEVKERFQLISEKLVNQAYIGFSEEEQQQLIVLLEKLDKNFNTKNI